MNTTILSPAIEKAAQVAIGHGNAIIEISEGWTKVKQVVHMRDPISSQVRDLISADTRLRYWSSDATPHNRAEEGFTNDDDKVALSFPRRPPAA
jgi:hypothetical protein